MNGEQEIQKAYQALLDNDFEQAIDCFEQAVRRDPLNADFHYKLSISCARSGKLKKALAHARDALRLARMMRFIYFIPGT
ncbi:tetratricopeptide repeat protein [Paenibacillus larvae]|uniref:tetratricopeptide repeat protein n=1 Tax=Paenibacillus larvae TaxID=1464 RepID=UPI00098FE4C6|nr:tetratricopeptide repeat protein [Paenibacillus larvae]